MSTQTATDANAAVLLLGVMRAKGWNQAEVARQFDVSEALVSLWLSGRREIRGPAGRVLSVLVSEVSEQAAAKPARRSARKVNSRKR